MKNIILFAEIMDVKITLTRKKETRTICNQKRKKKWIFFVFIYLLLGLRCLTKVLSIKSVFFSFFPRE